MLIKYVYIVFVGILMAAFVGVGVEAFYKSPEYPETPVSMRYPQMAEREIVSTVSAQMHWKEEMAFEAKSKEFQKINNEHSRNVSIIALIAAVVMLVVSLTILRDVLVIADGVLLGGVLTLGYSVIRGFNSHDDIVRFIVVSVSLVVALILGYVKFVRLELKKSR